MGYIVKSYREKQEEANKQVSFEDQEEIEKIKVQLKKEQKQLIEDQEDLKQKQLKLQQDIETFEKKKKEWEKTQAKA